MSSTNYFNAKYYPAILLILLAVIAITVGIMLSLRPANQESQIDTVVASPGTRNIEPQALTDFNLKDQKGRPFGVEQLKGEWTFMFFGYMGCPDVCPTALAVMQNIATVLERDPRQIRSQFVFVSIDPERDALANLGDYVEYFNADFIGVSGNPLQLQGLVQQLGVEVKPVQDDSSRNYLTSYLMSHTSSIMLIDPLARLQTKYPPPHERASILSQFYSSLYQYELKNSKP